MASGGLEVSMSLTDNEHQKPTGYCPVIGMLRNL